MNKADYVAIVLGSDSACMLQVNKHTTKAAEHIKTAMKLLQNSNMPSQATKGVAKPSKV